MGDSRNFTALDWVTGEINETLMQARQALEAHVVNRDDPTQMRFCLTYLHQVHSILQMVEFHSGALLAEELEKLAQALVEGSVANSHDAHEILMRAMLQLPAYLDAVKMSRQDDPGSLLPLLNDLRAVRGGALLTETALFSPNMAAARNIKTPRAKISEEAFLDAAKKLRQMYQLALVSIIKDRDYDSNLPRLEKIFNNFEKICQGTRYQPLWQICLALVEGLSSDSISAGVAINNLLREIEKVIKQLASEGMSALDHFKSEELIKNLLYYIAGSNGNTPRINAIKEIFKLSDALPKVENEKDSGGLITGVDPDAMRSVVVALTEEFSKIKEVFDNYVNKKEENNEALRKTLPIFKQTADTLAVLGQGALRKTIEKLVDELTTLASADTVITGDSLMNAAAKLLEVEGALNSQFNRDASKADNAPPSMDIAMLTAQETVLFECQNGLEQAKDAIVEYIASQWDSKHIAPLPALLMDIRGSMEMVNQRRCARVLSACARYIKDKLIDGKHTPNWQEMDTLADAIAGVEYYLETLDEDVIEDEDTVLAVAEESVANLGYAVTTTRKSASKLATDENVVELVDLPDLNELDAEIAEQNKRTPLTKEKLAAILAEDKEQESAAEIAAKEAKQAEMNAEKALKREKAATRVPDDGPLLSDDEFNNIQTPTDDLVIETEFNFDAFAKANAQPQLTPSSVDSNSLSDAAEPEKQNYGVIEFESVVEPAQDVTDELPEIEFTDAINLDLAVEAAEENITEDISFETVDALPAETTFDDDPGNLIIDNFETDFDDEISEIFIEEIQEVLATINEFYPQWKASGFKDEAALKEFRRGFHTMKGSGRMAKAISVGELAWSVENMLNRVMDGTIKPSNAVCELIERVLIKAPGMMSAFSQKQPDPDPRLSRRYRLIGEALSKGEEPLPFDVTRAPLAVSEAQVAVSQQPETEEMPASAEPDWELWDIFTAEAESHLEVADQWIANAMEQSPLPVEPTDLLQRALHTLKGSAYMADLKAIGDLATPLEKFVKALRAFQILVGDDFTNLLMECSSEIRNGLQQIQDRQPVALHNTEKLHKRINAMRLEMTGESEDAIAAELTGVRPVSFATVDPTLWNEFLAGDIDALMGASDILDAWQFDTNNMAGSNAAILQLCAELEKMANGAEPAGLKPISTLSNLLSRSYHKVIAAGGAGKEHLLPLAHTGQELLINYIDELTGGQNIAHHAELESQLLAFIESNIELETQPIETVDVIEMAAAPVAEIEVEEIAEPDVAVALENTQPAAVELTSPSDFDMELLEIFIEEAAELLEELEATIGNWNEDPSNASYADALKRTLHTYKGGARMAGLAVLGTLAHDLETQLETFSGIADQRLFNQINDYQERLIKGTERARQLRAGETVNFAELALGYVAAPVVAAAPAASEVVPNVVDAVDFADEDSGITEMDMSAAEPIELAELDEAIPEEPVTAEPVAASVPARGALEYSADIDPELLAIFIEEALELLEELDRGIADWQKEPSASGFVDSLKRTLHTLKGGARMAGMTGLGSLAHDLETYLETFSGSGDTALFAMLHDYQDKIIRGVEQAQALAAGEVPQVAPEAAGEVSDRSWADESIEVEAVDYAVAEPSLVIERARIETTDAELPVSDIVVRPTADILPFKAQTLPKGLDLQADKRAEAAQTAKDAGPQEMVKIAAELVDQLVNLAGETSISRGRVEQQVIDFALTLNDVDATIKRLQDLLRRMEIETEAQVQSKIEEIQLRKDDFDPLEMDRYSTLQQLTRSLMETSSDLIDLRTQLTNKARETEMILLQQSRINTELQEGLMRSRMVPFSRMVPRLRRIVRQVSGELKKEVDFDLVNVEGEMDRTVLERMVAPLEHMLRNAMDHGIEMPAVREKAGKSRRGYVVLSFGREGGDVVITLKDDGGGIPVDKVRKKAIERGLITEETQLTDHEILQFIMQAGFSTAEKVTQISGRGVGMDVVHSEIKQLGGSMTINSKQGMGTEFVVRLPFTVSVNRALMVGIGDDLFAVPLNSIEGIVRVSPFELENYYQDKDARFEYAGTLYEVRYLGEMLRTKERPVLGGLVLPESVILVRGADHSIALHVDQLLGSREIVVKSLGPQFASVPGLSGATILGDGSVLVILDLMALVRSTILIESQSMMFHHDQQLLAPKKEVFTVMVVDDSVTVRKVTSRFLEREGFEVILAKDGADAMLQLQDRVPDIMLLDIEMPRMDGFEVATSVKNTDRLKQIPIIMITSRTGDKHRERAMGIGVERYMGKPFVEDELLQTINELVAAKIRSTGIHRAVTVE
jgi:chemosensory pili system protein ChpA (sensor histidine kinase/response regulator)